MWRFNTEKTNRRYGLLQDYYKANGLNADCFSCVHFGECAGSQRAGVIKQYSGGTAGLMPYYDVSFDQTDLRVMVIGKETGYMQNAEHGTSANFDVNTLNLLNCINWKRKNNHIKGTLITLQRIFQCETEYIYASYAMSDALRCAFQSTERSSSVSAVQDTATMRRNCLRYLIDEIKILEPTLVIVQGEWAVRDRRMPFVERLGHELGTRPKCLKTNSSGVYGLYEFPHFMCITSHHPAILGHWMVNLAPDSLWPMIEHLREIGYIPKFPASSGHEYESIVRPHVDAIISNLPSNDTLRSSVKHGQQQMNLF